MTGERADMLKGFVEGDPAAVAAVVDEYCTPLLNFLLRLGCPRDDAEDVIQESLIKAAKGLVRRHENRNRFRPWLFRVALNTFRDHRRKAFSRKEVPSDPESLAGCQRRSRKTRKTAQKKQLSAVT